MAYVSKVWVDRQTEYPTRRKLAFDDGTGDKIVTVSREEGTIYEAGDIFDANTMNTLESRIAAGIAEKQDILIPGNGIRIDQDNVISATGGGGGIEFTKIESGSLVSVNDAADLPVVDLAVEIEAVQSGTGDPSPSNVRPISGWSNVGVTRAGKNFFTQTGETADTYLRESGEAQGGVGASGWTLSDYIEVKGGETYYFNPNTTSGTTAKHGYFDSEKNFISAINSGAISFTTPSNAKYMRFSYRSASTDIQLELGNSPSSFSPYVAPTTVTIALEQTIFGGELDVTSGVLKITHGFDTFDGDSVTNVSEVSGVQYARVLASELSIDGTTSRMLCDSYNPVDVSANGNIRWVSRSHQVVRIFDSRFTTIENAQAILNAQPVHLCYELATPVTVQLTPTEIETLLGINNIWADSGDILNLEYYTQSASDVRDFIIKDEEITDDASWSSEKIQDELDAKQETLTAGAGIVINQNNEISAILYKELTANLQPPATSVVFNDASITTSSTIDIYTSQYGFNPETVTVETGKITLTFRSVESSVGVKVRVS